MTGYRGASIPLYVGNKDLKEREIEWLLEHRDWHKDVGTSCPEDPPTRACLRARRLRRKA